MDGIKITDMEKADLLQDEDLMLIVQNNESKKIDSSVIVDKISDMVINKEEDIKRVQIGTRNLALNTNSDKDTFNSFDNRVNDIAFSHVIENEFLELNDSVSITFILETSELVVNNPNLDKYTIEYEFIGDRTGRICSKSIKGKIIVNDGGNNRIKFEDKIKVDSVFNNNIKVTFAIKTSYIAQGKMVLKNLMVERGNTQSTYKPSPNDLGKILSETTGIVNSRIEEIKSEIKTQIEDNVTKTQSEIDILKEDTQKKIEITKDAINIEINGLKDSTKIIHGDIDELNNGITKVLEDVNTRITVEKGKIEEEISGITSTIANGITEKVEVNTLAVTKLKDELKSMATQASVEVVSKTINDVEKSVTTKIENNKSLIDQKADSITLQVEGLEKTTSVIKNKIDEISAGGADNKEYVDGQIQKIHEEFSSDFAKIKIEKGKIEEEVGSIKISTDEISKTISDLKSSDVLSAGIGKWKACVYENIKDNTGSKIGIIDVLGKTLVNKYLLDDGEELKGLNSNDLVYAKTSAFFEEDVNYTGKIITTGNGSLYINGQLIANSYTNKPTAINFNFKRGWATLEVVYDCNPGKNSFKFDSAINYKNINAYMENENSAINNTLKMYSKEVAQESAQLAKDQAIASADGLITAEEQARINADKENLQESLNKISEVKVLADDVSSKLDNLKIGTSNLLDNSRYMTDTTGWKASNLRVFEDKDVPTEIRIGENLFYNYNNTQDERTISQSVDVNLGEDTFFTASCSLYLEDSVVNAELYLIGYNAAGSMIFAQSTLYDTKNRWLKCVNTQLIPKSVRTLQVRIDNNKGGSNKNSIWFTKIKLEEGNVATDWSPSANDLKHYSDNVAEAKAKLAQEQAIAEADGRITKEEEARIAEAAKNLEIAINTANKVKADAIDMINNINIGGVNLIDGTGFEDLSCLSEQTENGSSVVEIINEEESPSDYALHIRGVGRGGRYVIIPKKLPAGTYTWSCYIKGTGYIYIGDEQNGTTNIDFNQYDMKDKYHHFFKTFIVTGNEEHNCFIFYNINENEGYDFNVYGLKIEKGNKATYWCPSQKDVNKYVDRVAEAKAKLAKDTAIAEADGKITEEEQARINADKENLQTAIDKADEVKQFAADSIEKAKALLQSYTEQIAQAKSDLVKEQMTAELDGRITAEEQARIKQAKDNLNIAIDKYNEVKNDIRELSFLSPNLLASTECFSNSNFWHNSGSCYINSSKYEGCEIAMLLENWQYYSQYIKYDLGETYTISCMAKSDSNGAYIYFSPSIDHITLSESAKCLTTEWAKYSYTFTPNEQFDSKDVPNFCRIEGNGVSRSNVAYITQIKLEKGSKATEWCPKLSDLTSNIDTLSRIITETDLKITKINDTLTSVATKNEIDQILNEQGQLKTEIENNTSKIQQTGESISANVSSITTEINDAKTRIENAEQKITPGAIIMQVSEGIKNGEAINGTKMSIEKDGVTVTGDKGYMKLFDGDIEAYNESNIRSYFLNKDSLGICAKDNGDELGIITSAYMASGISDGEHRGNNRCWIDPTGRPFKGVGFMGGDLAGFLSIGIDNNNSTDDSFLEAFRIHKNGWMNMGTSINMCYQYSLNNSLGVNPNEWVGLLVNRVYITGSDVASNSWDSKDLWLNNTLGPDALANKIVGGRVHVGDGFNKYRHGPLYCGEFKCYGKKQRIVDCGDLGYVGMQAYETATPTFGDFGSAVTDEDGICYVMLEREQMEVSNTNIGYNAQVTIESEDLNAKVQIAKKTPNMIKFIGTPNTKFDYQLSFVQKGFENVRFDKDDTERTLNTNFGINDDVQKETVAYRDKVNRDDTLLKNIQMERDFRLARTKKLANENVKNSTSTVFNILDNLNSMKEGMQNGNI